MILAEVVLPQPGGPSNKTHLGLLVSLTLLVAMITNLVVLPTLLLTLERKITTKSFEEPYFDAYAEESELDWDNLSLEGEGNNDNTDTIEPKSDE